MIKLEKKQVKFISILIAVVFVGSVVALALPQGGVVRGRCCGLPSGRQPASAARGGQCRDAEGCAGGTGGF